MTSPRARSRSPRIQAHEDRSLQAGDIDKSVGSEERGSHTVTCCALFGGPASGKTTLGRLLQAQLPGFVHVSSGELARLVTPHEGSPFLSSIRRQLADRRRRKVAFSRLTDVLHKVVAEGLRASPETVGIIVDGLRPAELPTFQHVVGCNLVAVVKLACPQNEMLLRLKQRDHREGDERLGLSEMDDISRVKAFEERDAAEIDALHEVFQDAFLSLDATGNAEAMVEQVLEFARPLRQAQASKPPKATISIDWAAMIGAVATKLDQQFHPDGKPR